MKKLTPVLIVDSIESCLPFWTERLGFERTIEVPERAGGKGLGFVTLEKGGAEVMIQSRGSLREDIPSLADEPSRGIFFMRVGDLGAIEQALDGLELVFPRRKTDYGANEVSVRDPAGNVLIFAEFSE